MIAAIDVRGAFSAAKVVWYRYVSFFSGVISVGQSRGIIGVRACIIVCDAILSLCVNSAVREVRIASLVIIRIVFIEAICYLLLIWSLSMEISGIVFALKDIGSFVVRSIFEG